MVGESRSLLETLRKRQKNWIGHVLRHDLLLQKVIEGRFQGKKTAGRARAMLLDALMQEDEESEIDQRKAERKSTWQRNLASLRKNLPSGRKPLDTNTSQRCKSCVI